MLDHFLDLREPIRSAIGTPPWCSTSVPATRRRPSSGRGRARRSRAPAPRPVPRGERCEPGQPLQRDAAPPPAPGARAGCRPASGGAAAAGAHARGLADQIVDTSGLSIGQLKERLSRRPAARRPPDELQSTSSRSGSSSASRSRPDLVFDVRFLTNPYWVPDLKPLSGLSSRSATTSSRQPAARRFLDLVIELLELTLPAYRAEGKSRLTVALGCTGGYHRSIALAEELAQRLGVGDEQWRSSIGSWSDEAARLPSWLYPGMHIKRWLVLVFLGIAILGLGAAVFLRRSLSRPRRTTSRSSSTLTGAWLDRPVRAAIFGGRAGAHRPRRVGADAQRRVAVRRARRLA